MDTSRLPFRLARIAAAVPFLFEEGQILSALNKCGVFYCRRGQVEMSHGDHHYAIRGGDMYIYTASPPVRLLRRSDDAEGMLAEADIDFVLPAAGKVMDVESLLFVRRHPCVSLSAAQGAHLEHLLENLQARMEADGRADLSRRHLASELIQSMGRTLCYEILDLYFANAPLQPLPRGKKDDIFQDFTRALFRYCRREREVAFYARMQHITPRYFSTIIKEKSGYSASHWIVQMVIAEAKQLLDGPDLSIKEIADQLNFPTQSFFGKYFKQYVGVSPKEYRKGKAG